MGKDTTILIDPALESALHSIQLQESTEDYLLAGFEDASDPKSPPTLTVKASGVGGIEALQKACPENDVAYGLIRTSFTWETVGGLSADTLKTIFIMWRPDSIPFKHQRIIGVSEGQIKTLFNPFQATFQASEASEITPEAINQLLEKVTMRDTSVLKKAMPVKKSSIDKPELNNQDVIKPKTFMPTGTSADSAGAAKGANVAFEDPALHRQVLADIRNDSNPTDWVLFRYEGRNKLVLYGKGCNGVSEMRQKLNNEYVMYGFFRIVEKVDISTTVKFCFVDWQPETISPLKKCLVTTHQGFVRPAFRPYQYDFFITNPDEFTEETVMQHIGSLTGTLSHVRTNVQASK